MKIIDPEEPNSYVDTIGNLTIHKTHTNGELNGIFITDDNDYGEVDLWFMDEDAAIKSAKLILEYFEKKDNE